MKPTHHRTKSALLVPLAATLVFAACGSDDAAEEVAVTDAAPEVTEAPAAEPPATEPAATEPAATEVANTEAATEPAEAPAEEPADDAATEPVAVASEYLGSYSLMDDEFGTMTTVTVDGDVRTIVSNALPNHETGEFPTDGNPNTISAQDVSYEYPSEGVFTGGATGAQVPGVALNGVKLEPGTAETVTCESGGTLRVEALQDIYNLGLDFNNAHVQPTGEYHYHGISQLVVEAYAADSDLVHVGFAADGFLIYYSKSGAYSSSYTLSTDARSGTGCVGSGALGGVDVEIEGTTPDGTYTSDWVYSAGFGDLDECNGVEIDGEYAYLMTDEWPFIGRCLNGDYTATGPGAGGPPPDGAPAPGEG